MPLNLAIEGTTYPPTAPYLVGREKVREFARAVGATDGPSIDLDAARALGHADLVAPPTFPVVVQQAALDALIADEQAGLDFSKVVHGDQRFTHERPVVAGDELTGTMTITSIKTLGGNAMLTSTTEMHDADGALVVTAISTLVVRGDA